MLCGSKEEVVAATTVMTTVATDWFSSCGTEVTKNIASWYKSYGFIGSI